MQTASHKLAGTGQSIAIVPTMGALHEGHRSLIQRAAAKADVVVTTIFVNPAQFGPEEDLRKYPRVERRDLRLIKAAFGEQHERSIVFIPKAGEIYPGGFQSWVTVEGLTKSLEGKRRPTHFRGVTTIVAKLFNIVRPDVALFGMKDYQQAVVLKRMTSDLDYPIKFIIAPTVREPDGLAMSSRNAYFDESQRREAVGLYYSLRTAAGMSASGFTSAAKIEKEMRSVIKSHCPSAKVNYIAFTEFGSLKPIKRIKKGAVCSLSVKVHGVELIDNLRF